MARPSDPAKLAALRARQAENSKNYRARQAAARKGVAPPPAAALKQPARYRPPRVSGSVDRAVATRNTLEAKRRDIVQALPDVRNPAANLRAGEPVRRVIPERKTPAGKARAAAAIRSQSNAQRVAAIGKARQSQLRGELRSGFASERLMEAMDPEQQRAFQSISERIARGSHQSIGLLFSYAGGAGEYSGALEMILGSPESRDVDEGLSRLEALAELAERAAVLYAPSRVGRISV